MCTLMHVATLSVIHIVCCTMARCFFFLLGISVVGLLEKKKKKVEVKWLSEGGISVREITLTLRTSTSNGLFKVFIDIAQHQNMACGLHTGMQLARGLICYEYQ